MDFHKVKIDMEKYFVSRSSKSGIEYLSDFDIFRKCTYWSPDIENAIFFPDFMTARHVSSFFATGSWGRCLVSLAVAVPD